MQMGNTPGPIIVVDAEATTYVPAGWVAAADEVGIVTLERSSHDR